MKAKTIAEEDGVTILPPDFRMKRALGENVDLGELFNEDVIGQAQNNVALQQQNFLQWFLEDLDMLRHSYQQLDKNPDEAELHVNNLHLVAISIKSQGGMFGYGLASDVARSLYIFMDDFRYSKPQCAVVGKHIDALQAILDQRINGDGGELGQELMRDLNRLTQKFKKPI